VDPKLSDHSSALPSALYSPLVPSGQLCPGLLRSYPNYSYDFVIVVDSFDPAAAGPFSLSISW